MVAAPPRCRPPFHSQAIHVRPMAYSVLDSLGDVALPRDARPVPATPRVALVTQETDEAELSAARREGDELARREAAGAARVEQREGVWLEAPEEVAAGQCSLFSTGVCAGLSMFAVNLYAVRGLRVRDVYG